MSDFDDDARITTAFAQYRTEVMPEVPAQNLAQVHALARRRGRSQLSAAAAVTAVALAVPAGAYAVANGRHHDPDPIKPNPSVSVTQSPEPEPSRSGRPSGSPRGEVSAPDGRISADELANTAIDLPAWYPPTSPAASQPGACPTKRVRLPRSPSSGMYQPFVDKIEYGDVDEDGAEETVALLVCYEAQAPEQQVVVLDRNESGEIHVLGQVVRHGRKAGAIARIYSMEIDHPTGGIGVELSDRFACCGSSDAQAEHQERWYTWDGERFRQTDGPTEFTPVPKEYGKLTGTMTALTFDAASGDTRHGSFTITVTNAGPGTAPGVRVHLWSYRSTDGADVLGKLTITSTPTGCAVEPDYGFVCHFPALAAGASRTYSFVATAPTSVVASISTGVKIMGQFNPEQPGVRMLGANADPDSQAEAELKVASS